MFASPFWLSAGWFPSTSVSFSSRSKLVCTVPKASLELQHHMSVGTSPPSFHCCIKLMKLGRKMQSWFGHLIFQATWQRVHRTSPLIGCQAGRCGWCGQWVSKQMIVPAYFAVGPHLDWSLVMSKACVSWGNDWNCQLIKTSVILISTL